MLRLAAVNLPEDTGSCLLDSLSKLEARSTTNTTSISGNTASKSALGSKNDPMEGSGSMAAQIEAFDDDFDLASRDSDNEDS